MRKIGNLFLGFLPLVIYFLLQFAAAIVGGVIIALFNSELINDISEFTVHILVLQGLIGFMIFGLWYGGAFKEIKGTPLCLLFTGKRVILIFVMAICYQVVITLGIELASIYFTDIVNEYNESIGEFFAKESFALILYSVILAPITEELAFRGVTLNHFKRAVPFWIANILQALLFGILHWNIVQGTYAFFIGIILGLVYKKYNSLYASIFLHFCVNLLGFLLPKIPEMPFGVYLFAIAFSCVGVIYSLFVLLKSKK